MGAREAGNRGDSTRVLRRAAVAPALALLPLRLFLGVTFAYAGIQKLSDPGFLHPGAPTYIGTQLHAFANGTPGGFLLRAFALPHPKLAGVAVALVELAVGLLVLAGLMTRAAAGVGLLISLLLFLTNSWKTTPYFLGSDIVFVFAWLPLVLAGASGQPSLDNALEEIAVAWGRRTRLTRRGGARAAPSPDPALSRREVLGRALSAVGASTLAIGGIAALFKGTYRSGKGVLGSASGRPSGNAPGPASTQTHAAPGASVPAGAVKLGASNQLAPGQSMMYTDPRDGQPDILIRKSDGTLTALSAVCTHQGCTVGYEGGQIACPCHGGIFNARTGAVEGGPPPEPLAQRRVLEQAGEIYALPA